MLLVQFWGTSVAKKLWWYLEELLIPCIGGEREWGGSGHARNSSWTLKFKWWITANRCVSVIVVWWKRRRIYSFWISVYVRFWCLKVSEELWGKNSLSATVLCEVFVGVSLWLHRRVLAILIVLDLYCTCNFLLLSAMSFHCWIDSNSIVRFFISLLDWGVALSISSSRSHFPCSL